MLNIAVVDDERENRERLCGYIDRYAQENNLPLVVTDFADGAQIAQPYQGGFDIIFLDIEMPLLGGMTAAERIRAADPDVVLVFVTNLAQYAIRGYEVEAFDFVLKPVEYYPFSVKLGRAVRRVQSRRGKQLALQTPDGLRMVDSEQLLYLETRDRMLHYHTADAVYSVRGSLQKAEQELAGYHFARCNQCYLVNLKYVSGADNEFVTVAGEKLEISRRQRTAFFASMAGYVGGML